VLYLRSEAPSDVTFRALVASVWGLRTAAAPSEVIAGARVLARFPRPAD